LLLTFPSTLPTLAVGLSLVTLAMFAGVTALQLGVTSATDVDRGAASAVYFSIYYGCGAVGGYLPGLAWQAWGGEGGAGGGRIIAEGTPEQVAKVKESYTGQFLKKILK